MKKITTLLLALIFLTSCSAQTSLFNNSLDQTLTKEGTHNFFFYGIGQTKNENLAQICGNASNVARTQTISTLPNLLGQFLTLGLWFPRTYKVYCSDMSADITPEVDVEDSVSTEEGGQS